MDEGDLEYCSIEQRNRHASNGRSYWHLGPVARKGSESRISSIGPVSGACGRFSERQTCERQDTDRIQYLSAQGRKDLL